MTVAEEVTPERNGNLAPDWGHRYGLRELWSEIAPGLFVGGTADQDTVAQAREAWVGEYSFQVMQDAEIGPGDFDSVVTMYAWARPVDWDVEELRWGISDDERGGVDLETLKETVVWAHRRWAQQDKKVLVRCQAGLNRSSLVAALVLVREGFTPQDAIAQIRRTRSPRALFNESFVRLIRETPVEYWRS